MSSPHLRTSEFFDRDKKSKKELFDAQLNLLNSYIDYCRVLFEREKFIKDKITTYWTGLEYKLKQRSTENSIELITDYLETKNITFISSKDWIDYRLCFFSKLDGSEIKFLQTIIDFVFRLEFNKEIRTRFIKEIEKLLPDLKFHTSYCEYRKFDEKGYQIFVDQIKRIEQELKDIDFLQYHVRWNLPRKI